MKSPSPTQTKKPQPDKLYVRTCDDTPSSIPWSFVRKQLPKAMQETIQKRIDLDNMRRQNAKPNKPKLKPSDIIFERYKASKAGTVYMYSTGVKELYRRNISVIRLVNGTPTKQSSRNKNPYYKVYWMAIPNLASHAPVERAIEWLHGMSGTGMMESYDEQFFRFSRPYIRT